MSLHLPFDVELAQGEAFLIAGMGGGFDVFCGLPLYFELQRRAYEVYLASLSFAALQDYHDGDWLSSTLVGVGPAASDLTGYHPERYLARCLQEQSGEAVTI